MKRCQQCQVNVNTERKSCPLCNEILEDLDQTILPFPVYPKPSQMPKKQNRLIQSLSFLSIMAIIITVVVNVLTFKKHSYYWSALVAVSVFYFWILLKSTFKNKGNIPLKLIVQMLALSATTFAIDYFSDFKGWALNYVIPFLSMAALIAIIFMLIFNFKKINDYLMYLLASNLLGIIPFILWIFRIVEVLWPSLAAAGLSFTVLVGFLVFARKELKDEFKRRFHV
ncbi:MAG TPA: DUF6320 domain-containing protein [Bacilli bacterium]|nr:MAG: hypothetical protein BWY97_00109 [Tenericutes bacterium ADurb.BinA124]HNZ50333.1 DUF6320 domain-containing protein [Bacilli bacterium]HOH18101.1 DUF6320 domain-containing protein [Bacilli bacterium]HPN60732.1 DUF6320 domain-containing protein [Bacilli bacterium]HPX84603.1 DUF6320 domain-containing protein [Bacilli bacterium]